MHGPTTFTTGHCPNCGWNHGSSTAAWVSSTYNAPSSRTSADELLKEWNESEAEYARVGRTRALALDTRRRPSRSQAAEPARGSCTRAHQRLLGGRQSYARVRCDRKRAVLRARRAGR